MAIQGKVVSVTKPPTVSGKVTQVTRPDGSTYSPGSSSGGSSPSYGSSSPAPSYSGGGGYSTPSYSGGGGGGYSAPSMPAKNPALDAMNQVAYWKQAYESAQKAGKDAGSLKYITNQAQGAYGQLDSQTAQQLKGMNAAQAAAYYRSIAGKDNGQGLAGVGNNTPVQQQQPMMQQEPVDPYADIMNNPLIQQMMAQIEGFGSQQAAYQQQMAEFQRQQQEAMRQQMEGLIGQYGQAQDADLAALDREFADAQAALEDDSFQQYLNARQAMANRGLAGSGLANDQDTRLLMANSKNLAGLQNSVLNQKAGVKLRYGSQIDNLRNQMASQGIPLSAGGGVAPRYQNGPAAPDTTTMDYTYKMLEMLMPYMDATVKDEMTHQIDLMDQQRQYIDLYGYDQAGNLTLDARDKMATQQRELAGLLGYLPDGTLTLDARDKGATQQRLMSELLGYLPDGTLTRASRKDANDLLMEQIKTYGYDQSGNVTSDHMYKLGQLDQGQQGLDIDAWYKGNVLGQNQQKIEIDSAYKSGLLTQNQQKIEQGWADVQIKQQNANTRLQELDLNLLKFDNQQNRAMYQDQAKAATTLMNSAYKDLQDATTILKKDPKDLNAQQRYSNAKKQYDIAYQAVDELAKLDINKGVKEQSKTSTQKKMDLFFNRVGGILSKVGETVNDFTLGGLSRQYESRGNPATIARTKGDIGGASYGTYQFATSQGTPQRFVEYLKKVDQSAYKALSGKSPGTAAFDSAWKSLAKSNPKFGNYQHEFTVQQYYTPAVNSLKKNGFDANSRSKAVKDAIWSTAVQHGVGSVSKIFKSAGITPKMTDAQVIERLYKERGANNGQKYFSSSSPEVRAGVVKRFQSEMQDALRMLS